MSDTALPTDHLLVTSRIDAGASPGDDGLLTLALTREPLPRPGPDEVLIRIEAAPINPSDIGLLFGAADIATRRGASTAQGLAALQAAVPARAMPAMAGRLGQTLPCGNEGAGTVVAAGPGAAAQALRGARVAALGGAMYAQYRVVPAEQCLRLPAGASAADGASSFVNPLTALGFIETLRHEGHRALVHTAAASNLGQMLQKLCTAEGIGLVNIVRSAEQAAILRGIGATQVVRSDEPGFEAALADAVAATGATLGFDATGGGVLAGQILAAMEAALLRQPGAYSRYGSPVHKQVYLYGNLDTRPTEIRRSFGMAWGVGGWLVFPYLQKLGPNKVAELKARVAAELTTTFASHYARRISLAEVVDLAVAAEYGARATGHKLLIEP